MTFCDFGQGSVARKHSCENWCHNHVTGPDSGPFWMNRTLTELNIELIWFLITFYAGLRLLTLLRVFPSYLGRGFPTLWACIEGITQFGLAPPIRSHPVTQIPNPNPLPQIQVHTVCGNYRVSKFEAGWHLWRCTSQLTFIEINI